MKKKPIKKLPSRRKSVLREPIPGTLGALLYEERQRRQISQQTIADALAKKAGRPAGSNARVSMIELAKAHPSDQEIGVFANILRLSAATLRAKRDASPAPTYQRDKIRENRRQSMLAPKQPERIAAKTVTRPAAPVSLAVIVPEPAGPTDLADWIGMVDSSVARMPVDAEKRRRWLQATIELFKLRGAQ